MITNGNNEDVEPRQYSNNNNGESTMIMAPTIATIKPTHAIVTKEENNNSYTS